ncbi:MAG: phenylalanine--tRNA ligase subunit beta [Clostridia bacterium]|nr:phenylalanine--tRNA ligase subunit beta [Clostridia bacterium]
MIISLNWIKDYVNLNGIEVDEIVKRFGLSTAEVEGVSYKGKEIDQVVVAKILSVENHPESKKLHILKVDDGTGVPVQVVCGAPNVRVGLKTYFARVGGNVNGLKIKPAKLAGVDSFGMCCGGNELGIEADTSGIVELDDSLVVGTDIKDILPIEDVLIEVDNKSLTNRPDLWGHYGIAREFATIFKRDLKPLEKEDLNQYNNLSPINIKVETKNCFRYCGLTVENVINKVSPSLIKLRLNYCGMRDINVLADMTNYLMLEMGQPMHAFDNDIVKGITVIETDKPVEMETLEGEKHLIETESMVICDDSRVPVAIAGVKGGLKSGITDNTTKLLLESACFDCVSIRKISRKIGLITDASQRYEKSLDPEMCDDAIARLVYLLKKAEPRINVTSKLTDVYNFKYPSRTIEIDTDFLARRGGVKLELNDVIDTLTRLGFEVEILDIVSERIKVYVPSFRGTKDVSIKEDLVEEIFRMYGYDNISSQAMEMPLRPVEQIATHTKEYEIKYALASLFGLSEVHSYVWNYEDYNKTIGIDEHSVLRLMDSSHSGQSGLRSTLAPTIVKFADENKNKFDNFGIFEVGRVWDSLDENNLAVEKKKLAIVLASENKTEKELYFNLKEIVEYISAHIMHISVDYLNKTENKLYHPVNSCLISCGDTVLGEMGIMHPVVSKEIDKRKNFAVLELDIERMLEMEKTIFKVKQTSKFQSVSLDFNFVASKDMKYGEIEKALNEFRASYILEHSLKDIYINDEVLKDKISYTINFVVTPKDKTLEASDIEKFSFRLIEHMKRINVELRN